jgi:hypothetical protein
VSTASKLLVAHTTTLLRESGNVYVTPTGHRTIVKSIYLANSGANSPNIIVGLFSVGFNSGTWLFHDQVLPNTLARWDGWAMLDPGDPIFVISDAAGAWIWISGSELILTA